MKKGTIWMSLGLLLITAALFLTGYNIWRDKEAQSDSEEIIEELIQELDLEYHAGNSYQEYPEMEMPDTEIKGEKYIGVLQIPACGLELPVMGTWSYPQ